MAKKVTRRQVRTWRSIHNRVCGKYVRNLPGGLELRIGSRFSDGKIKEYASRKELVDAIMAAVGRLGL
jgi:hypothetical protein